MTGLITGSNKSRKSKNNLNNWKNSSNKGKIMSTNASEVKKTGLDLLRDPFPAHQVSKLPKESKNQKSEREADRSKGINCQSCGGWHHKNAVHLDYVGHAALTDRLLDADINWTWEPMALHDGLPAFDVTGGLWIKLTVCGQTRLGYGHAAKKDYGDIGSREKEVIGDALRNAAMRFGAALDLWHKGDLHADDPADKSPAEAYFDAAAIEAIKKKLAGAPTSAALAEAWACVPIDLHNQTRDVANARKAELKKLENHNESLRNYRGIPRNIANA